MPRDLLAREPRDLLADSAPPTEPKYRGPLEETVGLGEVALQMATGLGGSIAGGLAGIGAAAIPGGRPAADVVRDVQQAMTYQPRTFVGQRTSEAIAKPMAAYERFADTAGQVSGDPGDTLGATGVYTALMAAPMLLGMRSRAPVARRTPAKAPSVPELRQMSHAAYKAADDAGVIISKNSFGRVVDDIKQTMANEGIDATLHPDSMAALRRLMADSDKNFSIKGAEILRRVISDAAGSVKPADRRLALIMRDKLDDFIGSLGPDDVIGGDAKAASSALQEARSLWQRSRKAETIENLIERAETRASQFSGSGYENALRTEFRQLAMNEKRMKAFNKAEQEAIRSVAKGGPVENGLRMLGKLAPTGVVSGALGSGAGAMVAGPLGAIAFPIAGAAARAGATALTGRNAALAAEMMRRGAPLEKVPSRLPSKRQQAMAALLTTEEGQ